MKDWNRYVIDQAVTIKDALTVINNLGEPNCVLFVTDQRNTLLGTVTDGDIRRGLISNFQLEQKIISIANPKFRKILQGNIDDEYIRKCKEEGVIILPTVDTEGVIRGIINLNNIKKVLPLHAVIMAGGKGERLLPLTKDVPKPMLKVGAKPIIEHNVDLLKSYGIQNFHICVNYLGHLIQDYFEDGINKGVNIQYINEIEPMGTLGSISLISEFQKEEILIMNSDLLTNVDFADFYHEFKNQDADMAVASVPYHIDLPYAIMEIEGNNVTAFKEKPRYTYFANAGIYLVKRGLLDIVPKDSFYNATDLMSRLIAENKKLINYPILGYWLDIGRPDDFARAQKDIMHLNL